MLLEERCAYKEGGTISPIYGVNAFIRTVLELFLVKKINWRTKHGSVN
jgi:hypothetical protein